MQTRQDVATISHAISHVLSHVLTHVLTHVYTHVLTHVLAGLQPASDCGRVSDPGKQRKQSTARVANPQQDAGGLQTRQNVGGQNVGANVDENVKLNVGKYRYG